ncbi:unnamed protein product [Rotaria sordida]|uniref:Uncharacterized protein n=1 Tax=Rotaria sordida TaxID=392033 RepID=A0A815AFD6_9BILA|nr:unnamed protein product [Rotaria sordida]CAF1256321.1 unnamed protein product [Rotaria sordida]
MLESDRHHVVKWSAQTNLTVGQTDKHLNTPDGIYFDRSSDTLYVADSTNNRIQKWAKDSSSDIQVARSNTSAPSEDAGSLDKPNGVWIDRQTQIVYVADTLNNRIMHWLPDTSVDDSLMKS